MIKRAIALIRVSTESQAGSDRASIPSQRAINERTAAAHGLTIVRTIQMSDVSGAQVLLAPEIQELLSLMNDPDIHGVVAREFSRLMRPENFGDYALLQAFADSRTLLYLPEGPIDFASKTGRLMGTIRAAIAGMERTEILERIWSAKEEKRRAGGFAQSSVCLPYGVGFNGRWFYTADGERVREAFRLLLAGETSYASIGRSVGIDPCGLRVILRNPIYTGWRVVSERRDLSPAGKYPTRNGRQGDRRKIKRSLDDVIRVKVMEPLISIEQFNAVQRILDLKKANHWRQKEGYEHRFTYNGYLACTCQALLYTKNRSHDYYICKRKCGKPYQRRDVLDPLLGKLFTKRLTNPSFLKRHILAGLRRTKGVHANVAQLQAQLESLESKRKRILDGYFENVITGTERDRRTAEVDRERKIIVGLLAKQTPQPGLELETLTNIFSVFTEFDLLNRSDKRQLLNTITPSIVVANYKVEGLWIGLSSSDDLNRTRTAYDTTIGSARLYLALEAA